MWIGFDQLPSISYAQLNKPFDFSFFFLSAMGKYVTLVAEHLCSWRSAHVLADACMSVTKTKLNIICAFPLHILGVNPAPTDIKGKTLGSSELSQISIDSRERLELGIPEPIIEYR